jgi:hypothetical protein
MAENESGNPGEQDHPSTPSLLIPYWNPGDRAPTDPGDRGDVRPLPSDVVQYLCQGITTGAPYQPGQPITVYVDVRNWGGGVAGSVAIVRVWWEFPATSFVAMTASHLIGVSPVVIPPRGETNKSGAITYSFPSMPPPHICLVACVDNPADPAPRKTDPQHSLSPLPGLERHWAQHNLTYVAPDPGGVINFPFIVGNPFAQESEFTVEVQPFVQERLDRLVRAIRAEPVEIETRFELSDVRHLRDLRSDWQPRYPYSAVLATGTRTSVNLRIQLSRAPSKGQFAAFEIVQRRRGEDFPVGGIALIVMPPNQSRR